MSCTTAETALPSDNAIEIRDLAFSYTNTRVLENVNLIVPRGDYACIVGPNGGGKTTLLRLVLGLLQPDAGRIEVLGTTPRNARHRVGYMPQYVQLDPQFPVRVFDVAMMGRLRGNKFGPFTSADRKVVRDALAQVGLADFARRPFAALSGGQRQRVLIARALACEPELLLLDEPTANLDPLVQDDMNDLLRKLNERLTVILVSHDVGFVAQRVRTVICVNGDATVHAAEDITGDSIRNLYGHDVQMVHHDHSH